MHEDDLLISDLSNPRNLQVTLTTTHGNALRISCSMLCENHRSFVYSLNNALVMPIYYDFRPLSLNQLLNKEPWCLWFDMC